MKLAVVGATGLVGREMLKVLTQYNFPFTELIAVASAKSVGQVIEFEGRDYTVVSMEDAIAARPDIALFSAGGGTSREWAPRFVAVGTRVIDNSSAWRMEEEVPLIVPEVNLDTIGDNLLIANPNCSTIQLVHVLKPLHDAFGLKRVVVSTYQSITGTGKAAVEQMNAERHGDSTEMVYPHPIDRNCIPHCDVFLDNGYTKEEMKVVNETRKILGLPHLAITCTAVRVPVVGGHSEAVNIEFERAYSLEEVHAVLGNTPGIVIEDDPQNNHYPMPVNAHGKNETFVGRIRRDESIANGLNLWIVADNLRKGAATNTVQIAQALYQTAKSNA
ncbi:MAG: aspartate-semialdehyde dehydrogenase [Bacteroidota bacterium]